MNLFILSNSPWKSLSAHGWAHANNHKDRTFQQISAAVFPSKIPNPAMFFAFQRAEFCESFNARLLTQAQRIFEFHFPALQAMALKYWISPGRISSECVLWALRWPFIVKLVTLLLVHQFRGKTEENLNCKTNEFQFHFSFTCIAMINEWMA